jgi:hypothetical protein
MKIKEFTLIALMAFLLSPIAINAQNTIEITPFGGWMFGGKVRYAQGDLNIVSNGSYGISIDATIAPYQQLEFFYTRMESTAEWRAVGIGNPNYPDSENFKVSVNYLQIGSLREFGEDNIVPFGAFTLGAVIFSSQNNNFSDIWRFAVSLGGGAKIFFSDKIGIRLQGRLLMPMYFAGIGGYIGTGGSGLTLNSWVPILQGDLTGGLIIRLGN